MKILSRLFLAYNCGNIRILLYMRLNGKIDELGGLTICTVSYKSETMLNLNKRLLFQQNPGIRVRWLVVNNTAFDESEFPDTLDADFTQLPCVHRPEKVYGQDSYHHGLGLNSCLRYVKTRYLLVLDPDYFILMKESISRVLEHMSNHELTFFGVPWHPKYLKKYRDFPCPHCIFIDTKAVSLEELDFAPDYENGPLANLAYLPSWALWRQSTYLFMLYRGIDRMAKRIVRQELFRMSERAIIGASLDTGSRIFLRYVQDPKAKREILQPLWHQSQKLRSETLVALLRTAVDKLVPRLLRFHYLRYSSCKSIFCDLGDIPPPEEFSWNGVYFGFHVRQYPRSVDGRVFMTEYIVNFIQKHLLS